MGTLILACAPKKGISEFICKRAKGETRESICCEKLLALLLYTSRVLPRVTVYIKNLFVL